jgi:hypothetical protein
MAKKRNPQVKYNGQIWKSPVRTNTKSKAKEHAKRFREKGYNARVVESKKYGYTTHGTKYMVIVKKRK